MTATLFNLGPVTSYAIDAGPQERRLAREHSRGPSPTIADLEHARHLDTGCPVCADNDRCHEALSNERDRYRDAYECWIASVWRLIRAVSTREAAGRAVTVAELLESLEKTSTRAAALMRGGRG